MSSLRRDLIERRLWPVAVLLIAAIVAVPFLLHDHRGSAGNAVAPAPTATVTSPARAGGGHGQAVSEHHAHAPTLHMSNSRDPFAAMVVGHAEHKTSGSSAHAGASGTDGSSSSGASPTVVDGTGSTASSSTAPSSTATGAATSGSASTGTTASPSSTGSATTTVTTTTTTTAPAAGAPTTETGSWTLYTVDLEYGVSGRTSSRFVNLPRLSPLPAKSPRAMFVGVADHGHEAAFLIGAGVGASGQGRCHPSRRDCEMVTLSPGQSEGLYYLTKNGSGRTTVLRVQSVAGHVTHLATDAQAAYDRHSTLGLCDLELGDPLGVAYDPTKGALTSLDLRACRRNPRAVAFPGTASGGDASSVLP